MEITFCLRVHYNSKLTSKRFISNDGKKHLKLLTTEIYQVVCIRYHVYKINVQTKFGYIRVIIISFKTINCDTNF